MKSPSIPIFVFDFDSTLTTNEALDELAQIALIDHPDRDQIVTKITEITRLGMQGQIPIDQSLSDRLKLMSPSRSQIATLTKHLLKSLSPSVKRNRAFFRKYADSIYVVTNGFREYVEPVVASLGIKPSHVFANTFTFDRNGLVNGYDRKAALATPGGKGRVVRTIKSKTPIYMVGDGYTDLEVRLSGAASKFFFYTENILRDGIAERSDAVVRSIDELLYINKLPIKFSYPKSRISILLLEDVHAAGAAILEHEGFHVMTFRAALGEEELQKRIKDVSLLGVRSKTIVSKKVLAAAPKLLSVGAFCIGTEQIALSECSARGIAVFNAPYSNTRSVVELALGEIIMLLRRTFESSTALHLGKWNKSAGGSHEVRGKRLGIVGYGNIGSQLSVLAESLGLEVYYYDIAEKLSLGNAKRCRSLAELLKTVDIVSLHVDGRRENERLIGKKELAMLRRGAVLLNLSRGKVVDLEALADALKSGHLAGAAVDVFPVEPASNSDPFNSPLCGVPSVILSPHVGGSTLEAQRSISEYVATRFCAYINSGESAGSVNFPTIQPAALKRGNRMLHLHRNVPGVLAGINSIFGKRKINILAQQLRTNEELGYVITDVSRRYTKDTLQELKNIPGTIRLRVLHS